MLTTEQIEARLNRGLPQGELSAHVDEHIATEWMGKHYDGSDVEQELKFRKGLRAGPRKQRAFGRRRVSG